MTKAEIRKAQRLCDMAEEGDNTISYRPEEGAQPVRQLRSVWYPVVAKALPEGPTWNYWLAADYGSYKGSFSCTDF